MKRWLQKILGITERLNEQKKTNELLAQILKECKRNSDLVEAYNKKYYI